VLIAGSVGVPLLLAHDCGGAAMFAGVKAGMFGLLQVSWPMPVTPLLPMALEIQTYAGRPTKMPAPPRI
jgi:hypothetical protein